MHGARSSGYDCKNPLTERQSLVYCYWNLTICMVGCTHKSLGCIVYSSVWVSEIHDGVYSVRVWNACHFGTACESLICLVQCMSLWDAWYSVWVSEMHGRWRLGTLSLSPPLSLSPLTLEPLICISSCLKMPSSPWILYLCWPNHHWIYHSM